MATGGAIDQNVISARRFSQVRTREIAGVKLNALQRGDLLLSQSRVRPALNGRHNYRVKLLLIKRRADQVGGPRNRGCVIALAAVVCRQLQVIPPTSRSGRSEKVI